MAEDKSVDSYYGESDDMDDELDLSFLDEENDDKGADKDET